MWEMPRNSSALKVPGGRDALLRALGAEADSTGVVPGSQLGIVLENRIVGGRGAAHRVTMRSSPLCMFRCGMP